MKKKRNLSNIALVIVFFIGLSLLLYPSVSNYWNSFHQSHAIAGYTSEVENLSNEEYEKILENARAYNAQLTKNSFSYTMTESETLEYESQLAVPNSDIMGYVEVPSIRVKLPIYHGTQDSVLQVGVGHLPWSSLPVGGEGTHCVLSGHRGLPSARLFTDIDELTEGDIFQVFVLGETLTYEVDQILIVLPEDTSALQPIAGEDHCTLVTCTPYGINTHRLLVRGVRIENPEGGRGDHVSSNAVQIEPILIAPMIAAPILLIMMLTLLLRGRRRGKEEPKDENE